MSKCRMFQNIYCRLYILISSQAKCVAIYSKDKRTILKINKLKQNPRKALVCPDEQEIKVKSTFYEI